ncbi:MAG: hypothetical protein GY715_12980, partial [Planctomycetes bacterium]|nr:hypothetical protein [Planctomycetota bacterium]
KFDGVIFKVRDGSIVPPDEYVVFLAKDNAFYEMVVGYVDRCQGGAQHAAAIRMLGRIRRWRKANPACCKEPDVQPGERLLEEQL